VTHVPQAGGKQPRSLYRFFLDFPPSPTATAASDTTSTFSTSTTTKTTFWPSLLFFFVPYYRPNLIPPLPSTRCTQIQGSTHHRLLPDFDGPGLQTLSTRSIPRDTIAGENPRMFQSKPWISRTTPCPCPVVPIGPMTITTTSCQTTHTRRHLEVFRPFAQSRDSLHPPSLTSPGGTLSTTTSASRSPRDRPWSLPPRSYDPHTSSQRSAPRIANHDNHLLRRALRSSGS
jgi:hypothetical protein